MQKHERNITLGGKQDKIMGKWRNIISWEM